MRLRGQYRQLLLFVVVLIVPSILVAVGGWMIITQYRDIRVNNAKLARQGAEGRAKAEISDDLLGLLDNIKMQEVGGVGLSDSAVRFVGWADGDRLVMPWDVDPNAKAFHEAIGENSFDQK